MKFVIFISVFLLYVALTGNLHAAPIHQAVRDHDLNRVARIIEEEGPDALNATVASGITPLHMAAALGQIDTCNLLISGGANIMARSHNGFTPLHWATGMNQAQTASLLLDMGAEINAPADNGITSLHWAASRNATESLQLLIERGADIMLKTSRGLTPLHWAVQKEASDAAAILAALTVSQDMDEPDEDYSTIPPVPPPVESASVPDQTPGIEADMVVTSGRVGDEWRIDIGSTRPLVFRWIPAMEMWVGQFEITNEQFRRFNPEHNSLRAQTHSLNEAHQPVVYVSWNAATAFCAWLSKHYTQKIPENTTARLPSTAEWQEFARCGGERIYPWGNQWPPLYGNFADESAAAVFEEWPFIAGYDDGHPVTCDVRESDRNEWGLFGVGGNVWEWCADWYDDSEEHKVRLGGGWDTHQRELLRIDHRGFDRPAARYDSIGFRVVLVPDAGM